MNLVDPAAIVAYHAAAEKARAAVRIWWLLETAACGAVLVAFFRHCVPGEVVALVPLAWSYVEGRRAARAERDAELAVARETGRAEAFDEIAAEPFVEIVPRGVRVERRLDWRDVS